MELVLKELVKKMDFVFGIPIITLILTAPGQFCEQKKEKIKD